MSVCESSAATTVTRDALRRFVSKKRHAKAWVAWLNQQRDEDLTPHLRVEISARLKAKKGPPAEHQQMGNTASTTSDAASVCSYMQPIIEEYADTRHDLEHARATILAQEDVITMQAVALRDLQNRLTSMQTALELTLGENQALLEERRDIDAALHSAQMARDVAEQTKTAFETEMVCMEAAVEAAQRERDAHIRAHKIDVAVFNATMKLMVAHARGTLHTVYDVNNKVHARSMELLTKTGLVSS